MSRKTKISEELITYDEWLQEQITYDDEQSPMRKEARKYVDRWFPIIFSELRRMAKEGVDPHVAWQSVVIATEDFAEYDLLGSSDAE